MNKFNSTVVLACAGLALAGCSVGSLLNGKSSVPQAQSVPVGNQLALPPDLQLRPPGQTTDAYQPNNVAGQPIDGSYDAAFANQPAAPNAYVPPAPKQDVYQQYGISRTKADGTAKTESELKAELKQAILQRKRQQNPNYGTVMNIGNIFKDE